MKGDTGHDAGRHAAGGSGIPRSPALAGWGALLFGDFERTLGTTAGTAVNKISDGGLDQDTLAGLEGERCGSAT